ncbi:MAG: GNAT family N-acetyltransferase [Pseudomonadota bacterium]
MPETITIRPTTPDDFAAVDALLAESYPRLLKKDYPPSVMVTAVPVIARARPELVSSGTYFIAEDDAGRALGAGGWTRRRRRPFEADIRHLATDWRHTRRGIARAILRHVFTTAEGAGVTQFSCLATRTAVPFYRVMGFTEIGPAVIELGPGIDFLAVRMERR